MGMYSDTLSLGKRSLWLASDFPACDQEIGVPASHFPTLGKRLKTLNFSTSQILNVRCTTQNVRCTCVLLYDPTLSYSSISPTLRRSYLPFRGGPGDKPIVLSPVKTPTKATHNASCLYIA